MGDSTHTQTLALAGRPHNERKATFAYFYNDISGRKC